MQKDSMISREFEAFIKLGGDISYLDILGRRFEEIKECDAYRRITVNSQKQIVLEKTALMTLAQDQAFLTTLMTKTKQALDDGNIELATFYISCAFN